jgi:hypothetical protein
MHCLKPEMGKVLVYTSYPDGSFYTTLLWWSVDCASWEDRDGVLFERSDADLGFLPVPTDAAGLTVLEIEAMP